jgi:hypothetical protein
MERKVSRRKWAISIRVLQEAIGNPKLSWRDRLRAVELLMCIRGIELPDSSKRTSKTARELVETRAGEKAIHREIKERVAAKVQHEAEHQEPDPVSAALKEFLRPAKAESAENSKPKAETPATAQSVPVLTKAEERAQKRWLHRLDVSGDLGQPKRNRIAAIRSIQSRLPEVNPLRYRNAEKLLQEIKESWHTRPFWDGHRYVERSVCRPARELSDLWG